MASKIPSRGSDQFVVRMPDGMRDQIKAAADAAGRSMNSEIVARLDASLNREITPGSDHVLHIILDTNGMPISWGEVATHLSNLTRVAHFNTAKVEFNVITPGMVDLDDRMQQLLAIIGGYDKLIKPKAR